jgi:hypothetical protein
MIIIDSFLKSFRLLAPLGVMLVAGITASTHSFGATPDDLDNLRKEVAELRRRDAETQRLIEELRQQMELLRQAVAGKAAPVSPAADRPEQALDRAIKQAEEVPATAGNDILQRQTESRPSGRLNLIDLSMDLMASAGGSTATDDELADLQGGGHDPKRRGFTFQQAEISLMGAVDPYFSAEAHFIFSEHGAEMEEAFATTQALPAGLQLKAGYYLTEFGRLNPTHPHAWQWLDQPVVNTRLFGAEGTRAAGARLGALLPLPWYSEFSAGVQNAGGETMPSFLAEPTVGAEDADHHDDEQPEKLATATVPVRIGDQLALMRHEDEHDHGAAGGIGGRPLLEQPVANLGDLVYQLRWVNGGDLTPTVSAQLGLSGLFGPNATGPDGRTDILGADWVFKWRPAQNMRGWPFLIWEGEIMRRHYLADEYVLETEPGEELVLPRETLRDWGLYSQWLYGFRYQWAAGLRLEWAGGSGESVGGREHDPYRDDRFRFSPLLAWKPSEFSRLRFQYNLDRADHLDRTVHSFWLGLEFLFGSHPVHAY